MADQEQPPHVAETSKAAETAGVVETSGTKPEDGPGQRRRPQGKGRLRRFSINTNIPHMVPGATDAEPSAGSEDEVVSSVQLPSAIRVPPPFLHTEPKTPTVPEGKDGGQQQEASEQRADKSKEEGEIEKSTPAEMKTMRDKGKRRATVVTTDGNGDKDTGDTKNAYSDVQLYDLLVSVNSALMSEMQKSQEVHQALSEELRGPLDPLGPVGRLVRLLYRSMRNQKRVYRYDIRNNEPAPPRSDSPSIPEPEAGLSPSLLTARNLFSTPVMNYTGPAQDASGSVLDEGVHGPAGNGPDDETRVWNAIKKSDRLAARQGHRVDSPSCATIHSGDDDGDDDDDDNDDDDDDEDGEDGDVSSMEPLSPPPPGETKRRQNTFDKRRQRHSVIEESEDEQNEEPQQTAKHSGSAAAFGPVAPQAGEDITRKLQDARRDAVKGMQNELARLTEERDAALYIAEKATYERDVAEAERAQAGEDNDKLRGLLQSLVDNEFLDGMWPGMEDTEQPPQQAGLLEENENHGRAGEENPQSAVQPTPQPSLHLVRQPSLRERQRLLDVTRQLLSRRPPLRHPPPPTPSRPHLARMYTITKTRPPLGPGFFLSTFDVVLSVLLRIRKQLDNVLAVGAWVKAVYAAPLYSLFWHMIHALLGFDIVRGVRRRWEQRQHARRRRSQLVPSDQTTDVMPMGPSSPSSSSASLAILPPQFPREALAELSICLVIVVTGVVLASAIAERRLWLDHNADFPRTYLHHYVLQYHQDTDSCSAHLASFSSAYRHFLPTFGNTSSSAKSPVVLSPYHWCVCMPTFFDPRFVTMPSAYLWDYWCDWGLDAARLVRMRARFYLRNLLRRAAGWLSARQGETIPGQRV